MQSSTAIAFRALIMLICLVSVPLFALFGKNLPEVLKGLAEGRGFVLAPANTEKKTANNNEEISTAATGTPLPSEGPSPGEFRAVREGSFTSGPLSPPPLVGDNAGNAINLNSPPVTQPASFSPAIDSRPLTPAANTGAPSNSLTSAAPSSDVIPPNFGSLAAPQPADPNSTTSNSTTARSPAATGEHFRQAENRLRELGATHYMLETWGPQNNRYRFVCKMAMGDAAGINRYFQAIDDDPWRAMEVVLAEVEQWRTEARQ